VMRPGPDVVRWSPPGRRRGAEAERQPAAEGDVRPVAPGVVAPVDALTTGVPGRSSGAESSGCQLVDTASRRDITTGVV